MVVPGAEMQKWSTRAPSGTVPAEGYRDRIGCLRVLQAHLPGPNVPEKVQCELQRRVSGTELDQETLEKMKMRPVWEYASTNEPTIQKSW